MASPDGSVILFVHCMRRGYKQMASFGVMCSMFRQLRHACAGLVDSFEPPHVAEYIHINQIIKTYTQPEVSSTKRRFQGVLALEPHEALC
jgi:hypothetical protein